MPQLQTETLTTEVLDIVLNKFDAPEGITADTDYEEMGFDSLVLVELAVYLSNMFDVDITDDEIMETGTVAGTAKLLAGKVFRN
jgi:acyl carrier protein